jgi:Phage Terminase
MTRGDRVCKFIETHCYVPDGKLVGKPMRLMDIRRKFILDVYDNPAGTARAYLSIARKNGKSALIAALALAHLVAKLLARLNSQIISGGRSRDQTSIVYKLAEKVVRLNPQLRKIVKPIPSQKTLIGLPMNVEYRGSSSSASAMRRCRPHCATLESDLLNGKFAHGNHPVLTMCARECGGASRPRWQPQAGQGQEHRAHRRHRRHHHGDRSPWSPRKSRSPSTRCFFV